MFTGIVQTVGEIVHIEGNGIKRLTIHTTYAFLRRVKRGASIAIDGICFTLISRTWRTFCVEAMEETIQKTTVNQWCIGHYVNLERSLRMGDEIGGHIVSGHVEGIANIVDIRKEGETTVMCFQIPSHIAHAISEKGFIALNGVSLTVTHWDSNTCIFDIYFIPETLARTTFGHKQKGDFINIETYQT